MSDSSDHGSGLRAKVSQLVGLSSVNEVDSKPVAAHQPEGAKQALKQMIERKQYNDAVRRREFDKLRQLRLNPLPAAAGTTVPLSDFQDSWGYSVFEERANTLKKIDEIEAQMSKQWWRSRDGSAQTEQAATSAHTLDSGFATTMPSDIADSTLDVPTRLADGAESSVPDTELPQRDARDTAQVLTDAFAVSSLEFPHDNSVASDPVLEEAAIRFANGDDGGAESVLMAALQQRNSALPAGPGWSYALLDIYWATSQQASFERIAAELAQRYGRAAPVWPVPRPISPVADLPRTAVALVAAPARVERWQCPATLDAAAVLGLQARTAAAGSCWHLDWRCLESMTPQAAQALAVLMSGWCEQAVQFSFDALETLEQLLRLHTPMGDAQVPQLWWQLRLSLLRLLGLQDDFELVALDFCVTYEISPPSWQPAQCQVVALPPSAKPQEATEVVRSSAAAGHPLSLSGEVLGDVTPLLPNPAALGGIGQTVAISCSQLRRVDFSAGGSLLNWLANAQAAGCQIRLVDVPQLLVAFFNLIGLHEHAHIVVRNY